MMERGLRLVFPIFPTTPLLLSSYLSPSPLAPTPPTSHDTMGPMSHPSLVDYTAHTDPASGKTFYYNAKTDESVWADGESVCLLESQSVSRPINWG